MAYDIREPRRLRQVFKAMKGFGEAAAVLGLHLAATIRHTEDSVVIVDLGLAGDRGRLCFDFMGVNRPTEGSRII